MSVHKKNTADIQEEVIHNNSTHRKRLISSDERHEGDIVTMNYAWLTSGSQLETHTHPDGEEFYYFLDGTGDMLVDEDWFPVHPGDFVTVPPGQAHSLKNTTPARLVFLTVRTLKK